MPALPTPAPHNPRIVSLLPSATEIVCALGFRDALVGRSHECDFPAGVEALPVCTAPRVHPAGSGPEIHREVTALLQQAVSLYDLRLDTLERLAPDLIVTQAQCDVCAVTLAEVERGMRELLSRKRGEAGEPNRQHRGEAGEPNRQHRGDAGEPSRQGGDPPPRLVSLEPTSLQAVWADIARVAEALAVPERGRALVSGLKRRMAALASRATAVRPRPRIAILEWLDPPMAGGNWMPELVRLAGGENLFGEAGAHSPWLEWDALRAADPDVLLAMPCGFSLAKTRAESRALTQRPGWAELKAVRNGRVALTDGHQYFNRPGPRLAESLEILAEVLHPGHFAFGHEGQGWERMKTSA